MNFQRNIKRINGLTCVVPRYEEALYPKPHRLHHEMAGTCMLSHLEGGSKMRNDAACSIWSDLYLSHYMFQWNSIITEN